MDATERSRPPAGSWAVWRRPALVILLVAPFLGETLSTSTPPLDLLVPWNLALMAALYGCGALLCRELARRHRLGLPGLCLLAAAYAVYEEALVDRAWFDPAFQDAVGLGAYSRVWGTNLLLAAHLTAFHVAVSICSSILVVERLFPAHRDRGWAGRRDLALAALALGLVLPLTYDEFPPGPRGPVLAACGLLVLLVVGAFLAPRRRGRPLARTRRPRLLGVVPFACTAAHFVLVYTLPSTGLAWPLGLPIALVPIAGGVVLVRWCGVGSAEGPDGLRVVSGILGFFAVLDVVVGLGGRYDLVAGGLATALALWWLRRRAALPGASATTPG